MTVRSRKVTNKTQSVRPRMSASRQNAAVWSPRIDSEPEFNPFRRAGSAVSGSFAGKHANFVSTSARIRDACKDTAPLQDLRDFSDEDSLKDVVAGVRPRAKAVPKGARGRTGSRRSTSLSRDRAHHEGRDA